MTDRAQLGAAYRELSDQLRTLLFEADPIGISVETDTYEYEPEVGTILPRLRTATSAADVRRIVHEEFVRWFDLDVAGPESSYERVAADIWALWSASPLASTTGR